MMPIKGSPLSFAMVLSNLDGSPLNLTGWTIRGDVFDTNRREKVRTLNFGTEMTIPLPTSGQVLGTISGATTATMAAAPYIIRIFRTDVADPYAFASVEFTLGEPWQGGSPT